MEQAKIKFAEFSGRYVAVEGVNQDEISIDEYFEQAMEQAGTTELSITFKDRPDHAACTQIALQTVKNGKRGWISPVLFVHPDTRVGQIASATQKAAAKFAKGK